MVSLNPNPSEFYLDAMGMTHYPAGTTPEDPNRKIRKPYTITKSRESWTDPEHDKFVEAYQLFDRDWKKIEEFIGTKTVIQIRSHAQKYFMKVQKNNVNEHVPAARPKRKATHPYPQKATKNVAGLSQVTGSLQPSSAQLEPAYVIGSKPPSARAHPITSVAVPSWTPNSTQNINHPRLIKGEAVSSWPAGANNCCSNTESTLRVRPTVEATNQKIYSLPPGAMPMLWDVYTFIGDKMDPYRTTSPFQKTKEIDPFNFSAAVSLISTFTINWTSPVCAEAVRFLLESAKKAGSCPKDQSKKLT